MKPYVQDTCLSIHDDSARTSQFKGLKCPSQRAANQTSGNTGLDTGECSTALIAKGGGVLFLLCWAAHRERLVDALRVLIAKEPHAVAAQQRQQHVLVQRLHGARRARPARLDLVLPHRGGARLRLPAARLLLGAREAQRLGRVQVVLVVYGQHLVVLEPRCSGGRGGQA